MRKNVVAYIKASLRRTWGRSIQRQSALKAARVERGKYRCAGCNSVFKRKYIAVDHIIAVGRFKDFNTYIDRLFCTVDGLQVLCVNCHKIKSRKDRKIKLR